MKYFEIISESQPAQAVTTNPAFKAWFKHSKAVDQNGLPLKLFHGTGQSFSAFDLRQSKSTDAGVLGAGIYFDTNPKLASFYARGDAPHVIPVYVSVQNPFQFTVSNTIWSNDAGAWKTLAMLRALKAQYPTLSFRGLSLDNLTPEDINSDQGQVAKDLRRLVQRAGHDGVIMSTPKGDKEVVAFSPQQVKSAIGNRGKFSQENPDIVESISESAQQAIFYHGTSKSAIDQNQLRPSERGYFGPGVYLSAQPSVAKSYGDYVHAASVRGNVFQAWANRRGTLETDPSAHDRIIAGLSDENKQRVLSLRSWYRKDSEAFYQALSRKASPEAARDALQRAGYDGIEGIGDGHEIVVFDPRNVTLNSKMIFEIIAEASAPQSAMFDVNRIAVKDQIDTKWDIVRYTFTIPLDHGAELVAYVIADGDTLDFADITTKAGDHPQAFNTGLMVSHYSKGIRLGTGEMRRLFRFIVSYVRKRHPEIKHIKATRVTGARPLSGGRSMNMAMPEASASSEPIQVEIAKIESMIESAPRSVPFNLPLQLATKGEMVAHYDPTTKTAHIGSIVSNERGFGRAAVTAFEDWAKEQGAKKVTGDAVWASLPFWMKMGYKDRSRGFASQVPIWKYFW